jgi:hypothetical protein
MIGLFPFSACCVPFSNQEKLPDMYFKLIAQNLQFYSDCRKGFLNLKQHIIIALYQKYQHYNRIRVLKRNSCIMLYNGISNFPLESARPSVKVNLHNSKWFLIRKCFPQRQMEPSNTIHTQMLLILLILLCLVITIIGPDRFHTFYFKYIWNAKIF